MLSFLRRERLPFTFVRSEPYFLEILPPDTSKGAALRLLRKHLSIPSSRVVAVGDNPNDKEMLEAAGFGVAVGNAHRELKKVAGFCSVCHDQHAVAEVVNWIEQNVAHMITGESKDEIRISGNKAGPRNEDSDRSL
ncbi:putative phosphatase YwpJ [Peptococcaceae bacterium CEB3]|nr:putative phosphatase YwpJ [Peptococcaceae bacterium CEB3]